MCACDDVSLKEELGLTSCSYFSYLSQSGVYSASGIDDSKDLKETMRGTEFKYMRIPVPLLLFVLPERADCLISVSEL